MSKSAVEHTFTGLTTSYDEYDSTKTILGKNIVQRTGLLSTDKYAGPLPQSFARPMEASVAIPLMYPHVINIDEQYSWVFLADAAAAAATRRIVKYVHDKFNDTMTWNGFITLTMPTATTHIIRGMRVIRELHSTGTVSVSNSTVTGTSTAWTTEKIAVGARIGFGSTDPTQINTWYYISSIGDNTSITLSGLADTFGSGTSYVIEELRIVLATTNATLTNGGLFVVKGINSDDFAPGGTTIPAATSTDNLKAVYWLADASTVSNTISAGLGMTNPIDENTHYIYVLNADSTTSARIYKYNIRANLSGLSLGKSTSAFVLKTGAQTVVGTISQTNNSRLATVNHGPGAGVSSIYFVTTTRVYRIPETSIVDASISFIADVMTEIPTGGTSTFAATSLLSSIEYSAIVDRFIVTSGVNGKMYYGKYDASGAAFDNMFGINDYQLDQSLADSGIAPHINTSAAYSVWIEDGIGYFMKSAITISTNFLYTVPVSAHWDTACSAMGRLITPSLDTSQATKLYKVYVNEKKFLGSDKFAILLEPYRLYARTSGIDDNTGSWNLVSAGDISGFAASHQIQFMFEFRIFGSSSICIAARIHGLSVTYEDESTDSHYQPSVGNSSIIDKRFAWRFATSFDSTVPSLRVQLFDATTNGLLVDDNTDSPTGTFERSIDDGSSWSAWNNTDKGNETTYIRYTPASLADNIKVRAILTQL
jgi:hypothetical protein